MIEIDRAAVLGWFTGKAREKASSALDAVEACLVQGYWVKGVSRRVRASLNKAGVASRLGRDNEGWLDRLGVPAGELAFDAKYRELREIGWNIRSYLCYNAYEALARVDFAKAINAITASGLNTTKDAEKVLVIESARRYAADFAPVAAALAQLDSTRPPPVVTELGASPTVTATLARLGAAKATICQIKWEKVARADGKGWYYVGTLLWPEGTVHGASRYNGTNQNDQCEACGHAIRNIYNWVPLVMDGPGQPPKSLWVGRDCAATLFGIKVEGEVELVGQGARA